MNAVTDHFSTFGISRTFRDEDAAQLERRFHELQRRYHPDRVAAKGAEAVLTALDSSSKVNEAYRALRDPIARTKHLLSLYGYSVEQSKQVPMELLELVMNVQEQVAALQGGFGNPSELAPLERDLNERIIAHKKEIDVLRSEWDAVSEHAQHRENLNPDEDRILSSLTKSLATRAYLQTLYDTLSAAKEGRTLVLKH